MLLTMLKHYRLEVTLSVLVLATFIALYGEDHFLSTHWFIDNTKNYTVNLYDDSDSGGNSTTGIDDAQNFHWHCQLNDGYSFPYCGFEILLDPERRKGLDLSTFTRVRLWLDYTGPAQTLRIYLRNYDPQYSTPENLVSTKYNQVEFNVKLLSDHVEFALEDFFVANWWLRDFDIPPKLSHPQFDNIVVVDIQTGSGKSLGLHEFHLRRIEFVGQRLSTSDWYLSIILVWLGLILGFLIYRITSLRGDLRQQQLRETELLEANALLDKHRRVLERTAKTDFLTGLFNRYGVEEALTLCLKEWRRDKIPFAIILLDLDHFKAINDSYGHDGGDKVLAHVASNIQTRIRHQDLLARWGGEEFLLVCRNTNLEAAQLLAEKLRETIAQTQPIEGLHITASFGVASFTPGSTLEHLFKTADMALYQAKSTGRNRVITANSSPDHPKK